MFHPPQNESSPHITDNFDPLPQNVDVPQELLPYIPHPLYYSRSGTTYYAPDSSQWFHRVRMIANKAKAEKNKAEKVSIADRRIRTKALEHGTSVKKLERREAYTEELMNLQDLYHKKMSSFAKRRQTIKKPDARERLEEECRTFTEKYLNTVEAHQRWKSTLRSDMSDDTKRLEQRLNKRNTLINTNLDSH